MIVPCNISSNPPLITQKIFAELEQICPKDAILASNTSTIDLEVIAKNTKAQVRERVMTWRGVAWRDLFMHHTPYVC